MSNSLILPASYDDAPRDIKTERHSHVGRKGDLVVELHFGNFVDEHAREAALFIYARDPKRGIFVPLRNMHQWATMADAVIPPPVLHQLAEQIYGFVTQMDCFRLLDAVMEFMQDLKDSPLPPRNQSKSLDYFLEDVERATEGGSFFVERGGQAIAGTRTPGKGQSKAASTALSMFRRKAPAAGA